MAGEITVAREGGVNPLNAQNSLGNAGRRGSLSEESLDDKISRISRQGNYEKVGSGKYNEMRYDEPIIRGDLERADRYLTVQEARKGLEEAQKKLSKLPPVDDRTPLLSPARRERTALNMSIRNYRSMIQSNQERGGSQAIKRLKKYGFTMKDINKYRNG